MHVKHSQRLRVREVQILLLAAYSQVLSLSLSLSRSLSLSLSLGSKAHSLCADNRKTFVDTQLVRVKPKKVKKPANPDAPPKEKKEKKVKEKRVEKTTEGEEVREHSSLRVWSHFSLPPLVFSISHHSPVSLLRALAP